MRLVGTGSRLRLVEGSAAWKWKWMGGSENGLEMNALMHSGLQGRSRNTHALNHTHTHTHVHIQIRMHTHTCAHPDTLAHPHTHTKSRTQVGNQPRRMNVQGLPVTVNGRLKTLHCKDCALARSSHSSYSSRQCYFIISIVTCFYLFFIFWFSLFHFSHNSFWFNLIWELWCNWHCQPITKVCFLLFLALTHIFHLHLKNLF